ncbi:MAG: phosphoribosylamine--glycine ligase [Chloroflexi bacterium]|nr:phosphoribosylamine--glycine ligase [Chloroflexota bacterium]
MRILIIGGGGREHAIAWKCAQSPIQPTLFVAPGNAGTAALGENVPIQATDIEGLVAWVQGNAIDLTVVAQDDPLALGAVDALQACGQAAFGPSQAAAKLEWSKVWSKDFLQRHGLPTAEFAVFDERSAAAAYLEQTQLPIVLKPDGLTAGKGVFVCASREEALQALDTIMESRAFGASGDRIVIEECLRGTEISVFAFADGTHITPLATACDYKRAFDGDAGPNTGGMGGYSPAPFVDPETLDYIHHEIMERTVTLMAEEGHPYVGVLYGQLMLTNDGPRIVEFNVRLGDPEAQLILPRLQADLVTVFQAAVDGRLDEADVTWDPAATCGVVAASGGYPGAYTTGYPIAGLDALDDDVLLFHAGTDRVDDTVVTAGGRVLIAVGQAANVPAARQRAYDNIARITFENAYYRKDIAAREV